jgi:hypothetical protein
MKKKGEKERGKGKHNQVIVNNWSGGVLLCSSIHSSIVHSIIHSSIYCWVLLFIHNCNLCVQPLLNDCTYYHLFCLPYPLINFHSPYCTFLCLQPSEVLGTRRIVEGIYFITWIISSICLGPTITLMITLTLDLDIR